MLTSARNVMRIVKMNRILHTVTKGNMIHPDWVMELLIEEYKEQGTRYYGQYEIMNIDWSRSQANKD
jgi:hypothetical protein